MLLQTTILPPAASEMAYRWDLLFWSMTAILVTSGLAVYAAMFYFCVRYRVQEGVNDHTTAPPPRILGSHKLELIWTIIPLLVFLSFFVGGALIYDEVMHPPADAPEIFVTGKRWMWRAQYPGGQRVIIGQNSLDYSDTLANQGYFEGALVLPVNQKVRVTLISEDVIHDFAIPAFRSKIDVIPGRYVSTWYEPTQIGEYHLFCDQYCGTNHSLMVGKVKVLERAEYEKWENLEVEGSAGLEGRKLFQKLQCTGCHNVESSKAPILEGMYLQRRELNNGKTVIADEAYIRNSIRNPRLQVRAGWQAIMPAYGHDQVSEEELVKVVAYIKGLSRGKSLIRTDATPAPIGAKTEVPTAPEPK